MDSGARHLKTDALPEAPRRSLSSATEIELAALGRVQTGPAEAGGADDEEDELVGGAGEVGGAGRLGRWTAAKGRGRALADAELSKSEGQAGRCRRDSAVH